MEAEDSALQKARAHYEPKLPKALRGDRIDVELGKPTEPATHKQEIKELFPRTYGQPGATIVEGEGLLRTDPLNVGVVLSGGPAPGGHNVIAGLYDALIRANPASQMIGFLKGPIGIIKGKYEYLTGEVIDRFRNTGGFDMIMSGRDKIETEKELRACRRVFKKTNLDGIVIVGGDDSNTNAAVLAEDLKKVRARTCVIGVPKTIDGDLKNEFIELPFGFDSACKTYSALVGNICRDATSMVKYWHFVRVMGRTASHVALECVLQTHPNVAIISEEIERKRITLEKIVDRIARVVASRAMRGKNYGVVVVPEGLPEFIPVMKALIQEVGAILGKEDQEQYIHSLPDHSERVQYLSKLLTPASARVYISLPEDIQRALLRFTSFGYVPLSQIETERLLIDLVSDKIRLMNSKRKRRKIKFSALSHFFGYEGRCGPPSNFDADYCYSLGFAAAQLIRADLTGYTAHVRNLTRPRDEWIAGGTPITMMLGLERRKDKLTPVVRKTLVDLRGRPFRTFADKRKSWATSDDYVFPGPIQYFGPPEVCDAPTITLSLERGEGDH